MKLKIGNRFKHNHYQVWVMVLILLASQILTASHFHYHQGNAHPHGASSEVLSFSAQMLLASRLLDSGHQDNDPASDLETCGLCLLSGLSWSMATTSNLSGLKLLDAPAVAIERTPVIQPAFSYPQSRAPPSSLSPA